MPTSICNSYPYLFAWECIAWECIAWECIAWECIASYLFAWECIASYLFAWECIAWEIQSNNNERNESAYLYDCTYIIGCPMICTICMKYYVCIPRNTLLLLRRSSKEHVLAIQCIYKRMHRGSELRSCALPHARRFDLTRAEGVGEGLG